MVPEPAMPPPHGPTEWAALALVALFLALIVALGTFRTILALREGRPADRFDPRGHDVGAFGHRLTRIHANAYESLPLILAVLLLAMATGRTDATDGLAPILVLLRLGQIGTHLISASATAVKVRFLAFFVPQLAVLCLWTARLAFG